jgi:galactokinase
MGTAAAEVFGEAFHSDPEGLSRGPGRVNLIGEHTDYNLGFVLPFAIDREVRVAFAARADRKIRLVTALAGQVFTTDLDSLLGVHGWPGYPLGVVWALGELGVDLKTVSGFDLGIDSDLPIGAGLSSSAALESAAALALSSLWGLRLDRMELARAGQRAENVVVGAPTGVMDQVASLFGQPDAAIFLDCRSLELEPVPLGLADAELAVLVIDTRVRHDHATGGYRQRRAECEQGVAALGVGSLRDLEPDDLDRAASQLDEVVFRRVRHVVTENQRVLAAVRLLRTEGAGVIGELLDASHVSMRDDFEISTAELDLAVKAARNAGALGARMTGGGFGGSAIALVSCGDVASVSTAVTAAFAAAGYRAPEVSVATPSAGASLLGRGAGPGGEVQGP